MIRKALPVLMILFFLFSGCSPSRGTAVSRPGKALPSVREGTLVSAGEESFTVLTGEGETLSLSRSGLLLKIQGQNPRPGCPVKFWETHATVCACIADFSELSPQEKADRLLQVMTTEEKVGQLFFAQYPAGDAAALAARYHLGGYVLMGREFQNQTPESLRQTVEICQQSSSIPLLIGTDEEGGTVNRASFYPAFREEPFLSPRALFAEGGWEKIVSDTQEKCQLLSSLGINVNLAPVCDLSDQPEDFIYDRSFGGDPEETSQYIRLVTQTMEETGMGFVLKHFPGYGGNGDTHTGQIIDTRPLSQFWQADFLPFLAGIDKKNGAVMVSHNIMAALDPDRPASLSPAVHKLLREELGFEGVIITDDLTMGAVNGYTTPERAAVEAVLAGNDLICCSDFETQVPAVLEAVAAGEISMELIDSAARRVLLWKIQLGLL